MKKINVTCVCASAEEYPGCADLLYSYAEVNVVACPTSLVGVAAARALAQSDVLVLDESVLARDGLQTVLSAHSQHASLNILLVYEKYINNSIMEYISIGVRGLIERRQCISLLRRAVPALCDGEVWMPRGLALPLNNQSTIQGSRPWGEGLPYLLPGRGRLN
jgi:DNA-binding NarL/FixJ family response regulator